MNDYIVPYCERITTGTELLNTGSNLFFALPIIFGIWALLGQSQRHSTENPNTENPGQADRPTAMATRHILLVILVALIAIGSTSFHALPTPVTHLMDIGPVALFAILSVYCVLVNLSCSVKQRTVILAIWIGATAVASMKPEILAHSLFYLPTVFLLLGIATIYGKNDRRLWLLTALFTLALLARAIDLPLCERLPYGTHPLWHLLTALACWVSLHLIFRPLNTPARY